MDKELYLIFVLLGFILFFFLCMFFNKKYKVLSLEFLFYSYIFSIIPFVLFSKVFYILLEFKFNEISLLFTNNITDVLNFILNGHSFTGGFVGIIISLLLFSKISKVKFNDLLVLYLPSLILLYGILKIGCFCIGCCSGFISIPIQLIESSVSLFIFVLLIKLSKEKIISLSLICFGISKFVLSFFRSEIHIFSFIFVLLFCLFLVFLGIKMIYKNKNT